MTSTSSLAGRRALATGGSSGIGAAIVRRLAAEGATVAVNHRTDREAAEALVGRDAFSAVRTGHSTRGTGASPTP